MAGIWRGEGEDREEAGSDESVRNGFVIQKAIMIDDEIIFILNYILGLFKIVSNWIF